MAKQKQKQEERDGIVITISGPPGSGKTALAKLLTAALGMFGVRAELHEVAGGEPWSDDVSIRQINSARMAFGMATKTRPIVIRTEES